MAFVDFPEDELRQITANVRGHCIPVPMKSESLVPGSIPRADMPAAIVRSTRKEETVLPWLRELRRFLPEQEIGVLTPAAEQFPLATALESRVWCNAILEQALADKCAQIKKLVVFLSAPLTGDLHRKLLSAAAWQRDTIVSKSDKHRLTKEVSAHFAHFTDESAARYQMELCAEEVFNNSLFHAFRKPDGSEKYHVNRFSMLEPRDRLDVSYGFDEDCFCLMVADNAGSLDLQTLFAKLRYDEEESNLFLERGRGLFLMRSYSHENYIGIVPGKMTSVMLLFHRAAPEGDRRPLLIRFDERSAAPNGAR